MREAPATAAATDFGQFARLRAGARADDPKVLREAARQFESLFAQQLLKASRSSAGGNDLLGGAEGDVYRDLYDQQMALHLASGRGLGIAEMIVRQLQAADAPAVAPAALRPAEVALAPVRRPDAGTASPVSGADQAQAFGDSLRPHAEQAARALGVPAEVLIAQAALETGWGRHPITTADGRQSHNYFGIKADSRWQGARVEKTTHEVRNGVSHTETAQFRCYGSAAEGFADYLQFVRGNPRYAEALRHGGSGSRYLEGLQKAGYATDPAYAEKINRIAGSRHLRAALAV